MDTSITNELAGGVKSNQEERAGDGYVFSLLHDYLKLAEGAYDDEIAKLIGKVERSGFTLVPLDMHFSKGKIKCEIGLAKGKKQYDKRQAEKEKDWNRERKQILSATNKGK